eukprot:CAMPEP_0180808142 /NCGR_PEP_ID=MMETSP1038_2-20121128/63636_1 /TAXON_ID=632150 /ORGANISM="Azadinium spinosum, Strain 3D9" /LENGTH=82 /DNA_ID=CAMNT_0022849231 /DNA_START=69 /DNA_END=314 /DNA_ORIENTATION=-
MRLITFDSTAFRFWHHLGFTKLYSTACPRQKVMEKRLSGPHVEVKRALPEFGLASSSSMAQSDIVATECDNVDASSSESVMT